jgi:hypothetical protein
MDRGARRDDREPGRRETAAPGKEIFPLPAGAQGGADGEVTGEDSVFEVESRIARERGVIVGLEKIVRRDSRLDARCELEEPPALRRDHLVEELLDCGVRDHRSSPRLPANGKGPARGLSGSEKPGPYIFLVPVVVVVDVVDVVVVEGADIVPVVVAVVSVDVVAVPVVAVSVVVVVVEVAVVPVS